MLSEKQTNRILAAIVFLISTIVYLKTVAPTTSFWDCGEFIACSYTLGVPHPPGAPLYILLGRLFSMIPFVEDIGLRVNIISSLTTSLTIMLLYLIIVRFIKIFRGTPKKSLDKIILFSSAFIGSLFFAFTDTLWFNAVEAEVYAISQFFTALVVWLILVWYEKADEPDADRYILLIAYSVGMAIGVHLLMILALPAIFLIVYFRKAKINLGTFIISSILFGLSFIAIYPGTVKWIPNLALHFSGWFFIFVAISVLTGIYYSVKRNRHIGAVAFSSFLLILVGTSLYFAIYIRSNLNPEIDENDPETLEQMVRYLNREQYGDWSYIDRRADLWEYQIKKMYLRYFGWQFIGQGQTLGSDRRIVENFSVHGLYGLPFLIGLIGMFYHFRKDWKNSSAILTLFIMTGIAIVLYLNQENPQPRERDYVYTGSYFAFAIWIGIGIYAILDWIKDFTKKNSAIQKLAIGTVLIAITVALPINTMAYHYHSHNRSGNYIAYDYSYNILQSCEPNSILFTNGDNDTFPLWFLQNVYDIRTDVRVVNLSLLNTDWYIRQLKSGKNKVPMTLSDSDIDRIAPWPWPKEGRQIKISVPAKTYQQDMAEVSKRKELTTTIEEAPEISFKVKPTLVGRAIRVQDIMVLNIIQANKFKRPIKFALTVSRDNMLNMQKYLRMDGLVFKLVTYPNERMSAIKLQENLINKFKYRGLNDSTIYFNQNIKGLIRNYHGAYFSLAQYYAQEEMYDKMSSVLDTLTTLIPENVIPMRDDLSYQMGLMYYRAGDKDKFRNRLNSILKKGKLKNEEKMRYATIFASIYKDLNKAERIVKNILEKDPEYMQAYYWLLSLDTDENMDLEGIDLLNRWLHNHPDDTVAKQKLLEFENLASAAPKVDSVKTEDKASEIK